MTDKGQILFAFKVKWHLRSHFADAVENYRSRIFVGHFTLFSSMAKLERGEKISPCLWLFSYPVSILGSCYRSAIFSAIILKPGLATLEVQTLFFHDAWVAIASLTQPLPWALKYFSMLTWETIIERYVQAPCSPSPWPFSWDCQQMIAEHLPDSSNFQSPVYNNAKSVFCCQPLVYNNAKSVFCCWECLIHYGPRPNHLNVKLWWCTSANLPEIAS